MRKDLGKGDSLVLITAMYAVAVVAGILVCQKARGVMPDVWALVQDSFSLPVILLLAAVWYWGIRLTGNWVHTFMGLGPAAMTALFLFISIPMMERRQLANKPGYSEYRKQTRLLI